MNKPLYALILFTALSCLLVQQAFAHCDTMKGPVVATGKTALEKGDITPVLKWVKTDREPELKAAFDRALKVRRGSAEARELADTYFLETLVRLHRAGEGAPYTGLKPEGTEIEPAIVAADDALDSGSVEKLVKLVTDDVAHGIRERFHQAREAKAHAEHNVQAGREFVQAYVELTHYVERLHADANSSAHHTEAAVAHEHH
jgi:hypothetical protein